MDKWLRRIVPQVDGMLAISKTVAADLRTHLSRTKLPMPEIDHFYLGAGIAPVVGASASLDAVTAAFASGRDGVFLCVGTVEPRKNHGLVLDVFDRLWASGSDARPCCSDVSAGAAMRLHAACGSTNSSTNGCSGSRTEAISSSSMRIGTPARSFSPRGTRVSLPLVEAMHYGLPVIASDIAVFHEVAGDYPTYFNSMDAASLEAAITKRIHEHANGERRRCIPRAWLTWEESARVLLAKATDRTHLRRSRGASPITS
jgi:glycosyltransferase involved in cell wall biosynthesis